MQRSPFALAPALVAAFAFGPMPVAFSDAVAAGREVRNTTRTTVNRNTQVRLDNNGYPMAPVRGGNVNIQNNRNVVVNQNRRVDIDVDVDHDYHPVATAMAVTAGVAVTAAVIGSVTRTLPTGCMPVTVGTVMYQQCGPSWYQPQYVGTTVQYVVVNPPR